MKSSFKVGDTVRLKSGGPKMTVKEEFSDGEVHCQWFAGSKLSDGWFHPDSIEIFDEKK